MGAGLLDQRFGALLLQGGANGAARAAYHGLWSAWQRLGAPARRPAGRQGEVGRDRCSSGAAAVSLAVHCCRAGSWAVSWVQCLTAKLPDGTVGHNLPQLDDPFHTRMSRTSRPCACASWTTEGWARAPARLVLATTRPKSWLGESGLARILSAQNAAGVSGRLMGKDAVRGAAQARHAHFLGRQRASGSRPFPACPLHCRDALAVMVRLSVTLL